MIMIEIACDVSKKLVELAGQLGVTCKRVLGKLLKLDKPRPSHIEKSRINPTPQPIFKNIQDELIPHIIKILYKAGGKAPKSFVDAKVFTLFQYEFEKPYYNETVSHGVPRWRHDIAWAKERAKQRHGLIKSARESGQGIWELTHEGVVYGEKLLNHED